MKEIIMIITMKKNNYNEKNNYNTNIKNVAAGEHV